MIGMMQACLLFAAAMLLPIIASAADDTAQWTACTRDEECVAIQGVCEATAVRVGYELPAEKYFKDKGAKVKCVQRFWQPSLKNAAAKCWQQNCQIVGK